MTRITSWALDRTAADVRYAPIINVDGYRGGLQAALSAAAGRVALFPNRGSAYSITAALSVPSNTAIVLEPGVRLEVAAGATHSVFDIADKTNVTIQGNGSTIGKASGAALSGEAYAVWIRGNSEKVTVEGLICDGFVRGVMIGQDSTAAGTARKIECRGVLAINSPTNFGICVDNADTVTLDSCFGEYNWLDGFKLRKKTRNVKVIGGSYSYNGTSGTGDGADCFAGGEEFTIIGTSFNFNGGSGLTVKTGALDPAEYGYVRNAQISDITAKGNTNGMGLNLASEATYAVLAQIIVTGGYYAENSQSGIYAGGRNITINNPHCYKNQEHGIVVPATAWDVSIFNPMCIANSQLLDGGYHGILINGRRVEVFKGIINGVDDDNVKVIGDYTALTKKHGNSIRVTVSADEVFITEGLYSNSASTNIRTDMTTGTCVIHQRGTQTPGTNVVYGSVSSTYAKTNGAAGSTSYVKTSGAPNAGTTGWTAIA